MQNSTQLWFLNNNVYKNAKTSPNMQTYLADFFLLLFLIFFVCVIAAAVQISTHMASGLSTLTATGLPGCTQSLSLQHIWDGEVPDELHLTLPPTNPCRGCQLAYRLCSQSDKNGQHTVTSFFVFSPVLPPFSSLLPVSSRRGKRGRDKRVVS